MFVFFLFLSLSLVHLAQSRHIVCDVPIWIYLHFSSFDNAKSITHDAYIANDYAYAMYELESNWICSYFFFFGFSGCGHIFCSDFFFFWCFISWYAFIYIWNERWNHFNIRSKFSEQIMHLYTLSSIYDAYIVKVKCNAIKEWSFFYIHFRNILYWSDSKESETIQYKLFIRNEIGCERLGKG